MRLLRLSAAGWRRARSTRSGKLRASGARGWAIGRQNLNTQFRNAPICSIEISTQPLITRDEIQNAKKCTQEWLKERACCLSSIKCVLLVIICHWGELIYGPEETCLTHWRINR